MSTRKPYPVQPPNAKEEAEVFTEAEMRWLRWIERHVNNEERLAARRKSTVKLFRVTTEQAQRYLREVREGASWAWAARLLDVSRSRLWKWLERGERRGKNPAERPFVLLHDATRAAEAVAIAVTERRVKIDDPKSWLARRARSAPGYVGWEPDALKLDLSTSQGPLRIERVISDETVEQENERLLASLAILRGLGLANERMLVGVAGEGDTDVE